MSSIELNFFTNIVHRDPRRIPIFRTIDSVHRTFDLRSFCRHRVYMHPYPFSESEAEYREALSRFFNEMNLSVEVIATKSLWDGYVKSIGIAEAPYVFQMEHDWAFLKGRVKHSAQQIVGIMETEKLPYLRFNKRKNGVVKGMISSVEEHKAGEFAYCLDNMMSNNPHFIQLSFYKEVALPLLLQNAGQGSLGIERELTNGIGKGATYGALGYPNTITHLNGKRIYQKSQMGFSEKIAYRLRRLEIFGKKYLPWLGKNPV